MSKECDGLKPKSKRVLGLEVQMLAIFVIAIGWSAAFEPATALADDSSSASKTAEVRESNSRNAEEANSESQLPVAIPTPGRIEASKRISSNEGTRVSLPQELVSLHRRGGVPKSIDQLRVMEKQQRKVAERVEKCTVSVRIGQAQGCGVIVNGKGYIVTAAHVAMRPQENAIVTLHNGRQVRAQTLGMNREVDAGLIRIEPGQNNGKLWPSASLGTSNDLIPGMWCIAMGHPGGYDPARGAVVRVGRLLKVRPDKIVTDCALIGGDSGGPLFNFAGELIAVHSRIGNDVAENLHVPIDHYDYSWDRMQSGESWGYLPNFKPSIGVSGSTGTAKAEILGITKGSPADKGGLRTGDIVLRFGRKKIDDFRSLVLAVEDTMPGERVSVSLLRGGTTTNLVIEIGRAGDD